MNETIEKVLEINLRDAEQLIEIFRRSGDAESLRRAEEDRDKWTRKLRTIRDQTNM